MFDIDVIARSHFTRKVDGKTSFETFKLKVGLQGEMLPFEYESSSLASNLVWTFVIESWGGYTNASGEWVIFMAWRCAKTKVTQYIHWTWDPENKRCHSRRNYSFTN